MVNDAGLLPKESVNTFHKLSGHHTHRERFFDMVLSDTAAYAAAKSAFSSIPAAFYEERWGEIASDLEQAANGRGMVYRHWDANKFLAGQPAQDWPEDGSSPEPITNIAHADWFRGFGDMQLVIRKCIIKLGRGVLLARVVVAPYVFA